MRAWADVWWFDASAFSGLACEAGFVSRDPRKPRLASEAAKHFASGVLADYLGRAPSFTFGPHGKSRLTNAPDLHFNVSHAAGLSVIAVSNAEIGIDIESTIRPPHFVDGLRRYLPPAERDGDVLAAWTRREALLKAIGTGVCHDPAGVSAAGWQLIELKLPADYIGHVAVVEGCAIRKLYAFHAADFAARNSEAGGLVAAAG